MAKKKKVLKAKEPIRIRFKELSNGNKSIYLDIYRDGKRAYEFLKLYLVPEADATAKLQNQNTLQVAQAIKAKRLIDLANNEGGIKPKSAQSKILLLDWIETYRLQQVAKGKVGANMINALTNVLKAFKADKVMLKDVDKTFCKNFISFIHCDYISSITSRKLNDITANRICGYLNRVLIVAVKAGLITSNPYSLLDKDDKIKRPESQREYLTTDEVKRLIETPCEKEDTKRAYLFACFCGLRISDIKKLTWNNIYNDNGQYRVEIRMQKTKNPIYLPLSSQAIKWLPERRKSTKSDEKIFILQTTNTIQRDLAKWAKEANINKHVTFHTSRHTFATMMLTLGADLYTTSKLLGHSDISTTTIYAKIVDKKKDEAVNLVNNIFKD